MTTAVNYLGFRPISNQSQSWYRDITYNFERIDLLGKQLRLQTGPGTSTAYRCALASGDLAEVVRLVPGTGANVNNVQIFLGRPGTGDSLVINASSAFAQIQLSNSNANFLSYICTLRASWSANMNPIQNTTVTVNPVNNLRTTISVVPADTTLTDNPWLGSSTQLELDPSGITTGRKLLKFDVETLSSGVLSYVVAAYKV
jgi:hypothetical protein